MKLMTIGKNDTTDNDLEINGAKIVKVHAFEYLKTIRFVARSH